MKKIHVVLVALSWLLLACSAKGQISPEPATVAAVPGVTATATASATPTADVIPTLTTSATPTSSATATASASETPTLTALATATSTTTPTTPPTATPGPTVTPIVSVEGVATDGTCVSVDQATTLTTQALRKLGFEEAIEIHLNDGGSIGGLVEALGSMGAEHAVRIQILGQDITGDEVPDLLLAITRPYTTEDGETRLLFYACVEGRYEGEVLFRRAGAGSRMEGLYAGGGAAVENVGDLNGNDRAEVFFGVNWPGYAEYYLLEWDGGQFVSLIEYRDMLGDTSYRIEAIDQEVAIVDVEEDGLYEILVGAQDGKVVEGTVIWRWDGEHYSRDRDR